jgi:hypothetical protein
MLTRIRRSSPCDLQVPIVRRVTIPPVSSRRFLIVKLTTAAHFPSQGNMQPCAVQNAISPRGAKLCTGSVNSVAQSAMLNRTTANLLSNLIATIAAYAIPRPASRPAPFLSNAMHRRVFR